MAQRAGDFFSDIALLCEEGHLLTDASFIHRKPLGYGSHPGAEPVTVAPHDAGRQMLHLSQETPQQHEARLEVPYQRTPLSLPALIELYERAVHQILELVPALL